MVSAITETFDTSTIIITYTICALISIFKMVIRKLTDIKYGVFNIFTLNIVQKLHIRLMKINLGLESHTTRRLFRTLTHIYSVQFFRS